MFASMLATMRKPSTSPPAPCPVANPVVIITAPLVIPFIAKVGLFVPTPIVGVPGPVLFWSGVAHITPCCQLITVFTAGAHPQVLAINCDMFQQTKSGTLAVIFTVPVIGGLAIVGAFPYVVMVPTVLLM